MLIDEELELIMSMDDALDWPPIEPVRAEIKSLPLCEPWLCSPMRAWRIMRAMAILRVSLPARPLSMEPSMEETLELTMVMLLLVAVIADAPPISLLLVIAMELLAL